MRKKKTEADRIAPVTSDDGLLGEIRRQLHTEMFQKCVRWRRAGVPSMSDKDSDVSSRLGKGMVDRIGLEVSSGEVTPQAVGSFFAVAVAKFLEAGFQQLTHLRPGEWAFSTSQGPEGIARFAQYAHLAAIERVLTEQPELKASLGGDYLIKPDIVVSRRPVEDAAINERSELLKPKSVLASRTPLRSGNVIGSPSILHATISVKWSMRSDRAQNTRTEALNVIRNRKGSTPRIVVVTMEPLPSRLASIAMGTGDIDCCYHAALDELLWSANKAGLGGSEGEIIKMLVDGGRLRDISDLPFDLVS